MADFEFYVNIEDSSGNKLGSGPLSSVQRWRYTSRFDRAGSIDFLFAASDPQASIVQNRRIARAYALLNSVWIEVGAGVIDNIETIPNGEGRVSLSASGMDLIRELSYRGVGTLEIGAGSGATHAAGLTAIGALAPSGWTFTPAVSPDNDYIYARFGGESVLGALVHLAERTQTHFYRSTNRTLVFTSSFVSSGVRAIQSAGDLVAETCAIVNLRRTIDTHDLLTRITPYGSGQGAARLTLAATSRTAPVGYTLNAASNYIENDSATATYGLVNHPEIEFKEITPISNTDADLEAAADMLFDAALEELRRRSSLAEQETYSLTIAGCSQLLRPMQTIRLVYRDVDQGIDIDDDLYILEATWEVDESGIRTTDLVVSTQDRWPESDESAAAERAVQGRIFQAHPQINANSYVTAYNKNVDENNTADFRFRFGSEVVNLQQVLFEFQILPFESTVKSIASDSPTTSSGGSSTPSSSSGGGSTVAAGAGGSSTPTTSSGGSSTPTSSSGGGETVAASAGGSSTPTTSNGGSATPSSSSGGGETVAASAGGSSTPTTSSGGSSTPSSSDGGGVEVSSASGGSSTPTSGDGGGTTVSSSSLLSSTPTTSSGGGATPTTADGGSSTPTSGNGGGTTVSSASGGSASPTTTDYGGATPTTSTLASATPTSSAGGGTTVSSASGGSATPTTTSAGSQTPTSSTLASATPTTSTLASATPTTASSLADSIQSSNASWGGVDPDGLDFASFDNINFESGNNSVGGDPHVHYIDSAEASHYHNRPHLLHAHFIDAQHNHTVSIAAHTHTVTIAAHTHTVSVAAHNHTVTIAAHTHGVTLADHTHTISISAHNHTVTVDAHSHTVTIAAHTHGITLTDHQHTVSIAAHTHTVTIAAHTHTVTIAAHTHDVTLLDHTHTVSIAAHTHSVTIDDHSHTVTIAAHTHTVTIGTHTHDVTIDDHTHTVTIAAHNHTVTIGTHTHDVTIANHTHTVTISAHTHTVTIGTHTHDVTIANHTHTVTIAAHTHTVSPVITTVYGIFRESSVNTYVLADLDYRVNGGDWLNLEDDAVDAGDDWWQLDITSLVMSGVTFRPLQANNLLEIRSLTANKTATIDAQLSVRNTIQAIAYV